MAQKTVKEVVQNDTVVTCEVSALVFAPVGDTVAAAP